MEQQIDLFVSLIDSKQAQNVMKCAEKNCEKYVVLLKKEKEVILKMKKLEPNIRDRKESFLQDSLEVLKLIKELNKLHIEKDAIACAFAKCNKEMAEYHSLQYKQNYKMIEQSEKMLQKFVKKIPKAKK